MALRRRQIDEKPIDDERRRIEHKRLNAMIDLCESALCRRSALLSYFGEDTPSCRHAAFAGPLRSLRRGGARTDGCDAGCRKLLSAVARSGQRFGAAHLADILTGTATEAIRRQNHDGLKTFGVGQDKPKSAWTALARKLFAAGALAEASVEHGGFCLTGKGEDILFGREPIALRADPFTERGSRRAGRETGARRRARRGHRRVVRASSPAASFTRAEEGVAAYIIFTDRTLIAMARARPAGLEEMRAIEGVGERKLTQYGEAFLEAISQFAG